MSEETDPVAEEVALLCQAIRRVSGGGTEVTFGELSRDEQVEQTFEALMGTLKAAKKKKLLTFEGELLLQGAHDSHVISLLGGETASGGQPKPEAPSTEPPPPAPAAEEARPQVPPPDTAVPEAPKVPEVAAPAESAAEAAPAESVPEEAPKAVQPPPVQEETPSVLEEAKAGDPVNSGSGGDAAGAKKWQVDMGYIDHRTADPDRREIRRGVQEGAEASAAGLPAASAVAPSTVEKDEDGKWKTVSTSYIDHRTADPDRMETRRAAGDGGEAGAVTAVGVTQVEKDEEGKWKPVPVSYINHRTQVVENLEGRKSVKQGVTTTEIGPATVNAPSATVKKESDGKWKVDTSYIGYRTGDPNNLTRKEDANNSGDQFADPQEKKYSYEELRDVPRPGDVDPTRKHEYLSTEEFQTVFEMSAEEFKGLPKWKQQNLKKAKDLF